MLHALWHLFLHWTGSDNVSGPQYGFFSGFGSIVIQPAMLIGIIVYLRRHNCHHPWCPWFGKHPHEHFMFCKNHHPKMKK